jgi:hypothetical protein
MDAHMFVKCQGFHIFYTFGMQMAVRLSALCATPHPKVDSWYLMIRLVNQENEWSIMPYVLGSQGIDLSGKNVWSSLFASSRHFCKICSLSGMSRIFSDVCNPPVPPHLLQDQSHCGYTTYAIADMHILRGAICMNKVPTANHSAYTMNLTESIVKENE